MSNESTVLVLKTDGIGEIILNRPEQRNALNNAMCEELLQAVRSMERDDDIRVVIIRANGPVFCAGADLKERKGMDVDAVRARRLKAFAAYDAIENLSKPCLAMVHGAAVGSGGEIASACDFIIASEEASFRTPEAVWGTVGATQRLPRIIGKQLAKELMFTGRALSAQEAKQAGLVLHVFPVAELEGEVRKMAAQIAAAPAKAMRLAKRCIDQGMETDRRGALAIELLAIEELLAEADWKAGIASFGNSGSGH